MKQKIFSLLVFMLAAVSTAWAQDPIPTYLVFAETQTYNSSTFKTLQCTPSVGELLNTDFIISEDNIIDLLHSAYNVDGGYPPSQYTYAITGVTYPNEVAGAHVGTDGKSIVLETLDTSNKQNGTRSFSVDFTVEGGSEASSLNATVSVKVYHKIHSYTGSANNWTSDGTSHWHQCNNDFGQCDESTGYKFNEADCNPSSHVCTICGNYTAHDFTQWTKEDATYHYKKCIIDGCPLQLSDYQANELTGMEREEHTYTAANPCVCKCGHSKHVAGPDWTQTDTHHYHKCTVDNCPKSESDALTAGDFINDDEKTALGFGAHEGTLTCETCGKTLNSQVDPHTHSFTTVYGHNDHHHWKVCQEAGCTIDYTAVATWTAITADNTDLATTIGWAEHGSGNSWTLNTNNSYYYCPCGYQHDCTLGDIDSPASYTKNGTHHWRECTQEGCPMDYDGFDNATTYSTKVRDLWKAIYSYGAHTYDAETQKCTVCELLNPSHTHVLQAIYYQDGADGHYANCKYPDCPLTLAWKKEHSSDGWYGAHVDSNNDGRCDACYYLMGHQHSPSNEWVKNETIHYHPCLNDICPFHLENKTEADFANDQLAAAALAEGVHRYGKSQDKATGSDVSGSGYYTCKDCSYVSATRSAETHTHSYDGPWMATPDTQEGSNPIVKGKHWKECNSQVGPCDQVKDQEDYHVYDDTATDSKYYICSTCGYTSTLRKNDSNRPHAHQISGAWTKTEDTDANTPGAHYHKCTANGCTLDYTNLSADDKTLTSYATHTYGTNKDGSKYYTCQVCGYVSDPRKTQGHTHSYGTTWETNADKHWHECTSTVGICNAPRGDEASHVYGTEGDARWTCQTTGCGYVNTARKKAIEAAADAAKTMAWMWDYEIPFTFFANNILNDRRMKAGQCYTVCLPYALPINGMKVYYVEQSSESLVGFHEQTLTELPYLTPCVVLPSATSSPLSVAGGYVIKTDTIAKRDSVKMAAIGTNGKHNFMGSLNYIHGDKGTDKWILQAADADHPEGSFKKIQGTDGAFNSTSNRACILPMRAYIGAAASSGSRMAVRIYSADNSTTVIDRLVIDEDGAPVIFDLQGRRVQNPRKGGLYIINGRKAVLK